VPERPHRKMVETFFVSAILVLLGSYALVVTVRLLRTIAVAIAAVGALAIVLFVLRVVRQHRRNRRW
jgi:drug/metabolite transporter superfamily protein YnfA